MSIKRPLLPLLSLAGIVAILFFPFTQPGVAQSDDILVTIYRVFALRQSWQVGIFYPRIAPDLAFGYGAPLFQFYPPLSSYLAALFTLLGLGMVDAVKLTFAITLLGGGLGAYLFVRDRWQDVGAGWLAAIVFVTAPYQLANIYVRGATAEALGLALFPWILWCAQRLLYSKQPLRWLPWFTLTLAALLLSHNALSLFFLPIVIIACLVDGWQQRSLRGVFLCGLGVLLALASSAFFWLPAVWEKEQVKIAAMASGHYDPLTHLQPLLAIVQQSLRFDYSRPQAYHIGWLPLVLSGLAVILLLWRKRQQGLWSAFFALILVGVLLLQLPAAATFWRDLPLVRFIQFPWRLFAFATLASACLIGSLPTLLQNHLRLKWGVTVALSLLLFAYSFGQLPANYASELARGSFRNEDVTHRDLYERGKLGFELFSDYQPLTSQTPMSEFPNAPTAPLPAAAQPAELPDITLQRYAGLTVRATVNSPVANRLLLNRLFLPGWWATVDGVATPVVPVTELGITAIELPAGEHNVVAQWGQTPVRSWALRLSLLAFALWVGLLVLGWKRRLWIAVVAALVIASAGILWGETSLATPFANQTVVHPLTARVADFADLLGYSLDKANYRQGDTIQLKLYWRSRQVVTTEYKVFVHLRDMGDTQMAAQHDGAPVHGFTPTTRWLPGEIIDDVHPLPIDGAIPSGTYQLAVGMYDPNTVTNLPVTAEQKLAGERIVLGTVEIGD